MAGRYIRTDILFNILVRLPAWSLQRLKYTSKEWFHTISDLDFAEAHFAHQSHEEFGYNVLIGLVKDDFFIGERLLSNPSPPRRMNLPGVHWYAYMHDSCKGLVLFQCGTGLQIANPITGDRLSLPQFYGHGSIFSASIGWGCDSIFSARIGCGCDGKLKVVVVVRRGRNILKAPLTCWVLTVGSRSWRELHIPVIPVIEPLMDSCWAGGALHWIYETGILTLDIVQEKFHQTEVTFCNYTQLRYDSCVLEWDGCFAIFLRQPQTNSYYWVWVLKESGWMKLPDINVAFYERVGLPQLEGGSFFTTTARNGETIIFSQFVEGRMQLFAYDIGCGTVTKFAEFDSNFSLPYQKQGYHFIKTHVNSVISCSNFGLPKRIGVCDLAAEFLAYLARTLRNLFKS